MLSKGKGNEMEVGTLPSVVWTGATGEGKHNEYRRVPEEP